MKNPPHPGFFVRIKCLEPLGLSISEGAKVLGVSRTTLSRLINGKAGISPEMAIWLSKAFGSSPGMWIRLQAAFDITQAQAKADEIHVERYSLEPATAT
jgi:addiction module HigA family antidote